VAIDAECRGKDSRGAPRSDLLLTCADLIAARIAVRIRKLGGTDLDVQYLAILAVYAVFVSSAGSLQ
jgi:hypothetical protein